MITPRVSNRAPSVTAGSAIHITAGESAAPVSAMLAAIITPLIAHPTAAQRCACSRVATSRSAIIEATSAAPSGTRNQKPIHGPDAISASASTGKARRRTDAMRDSMSSRRSRRNWPARSSPRPSMT